MSAMLSPIIGFIAAELLFLALKYLVHNPALYQEPKGATPPPLWIRAILVLTCTGVSFAHGSNDGQKGMGLIMLILIGCVPTAYALNRAMPDTRVEQFHTTGTAAQTVLQKLAPGQAPADSRAAVADFIRTKQLQPDTIPAVTELVSEIDAQVNEYGTLRKIPTAAVGNVRNDMYLVSEAIRVMMKTGCRSSIKRRETSSPPTKASSTTPPNTSRSGSRSRSPSRSGSAPWSAGSASW